MVLRMAAGPDYPADRWPVGTRWLVGHGRIRWLIDGTAGAVVGIIFAASVQDPDWRLRVGAFVLGAAAIMVLLRWMVWQFVSFQHWKHPRGLVEITWGRRWVVFAGNGSLHRVPVADVGVDDAGEVRVQGALWGRLPPRVLDRFRAGRPAP